MTSKTRAILLALGIWPESKPIKTTLRDQLDELRCQRREREWDGVYRWTLWDGREFAFRLEEAERDELYECRLVCDDRPREPRSAGEIRAEMMAWLGGGDE